MYENVYNFTLKFCVHLNLCTQPLLPTPLPLFPTQHIILILYNVVQYVYTFPYTTIILTIQYTIGYSKFT